MKANELKNKSAADLSAELNELLQEQFKLRMQKATGQLTKTHLTRNVRRNIARVKTLLSQQEGK